MDELAQLLRRLKVRRLGRVLMYAGLAVSGVFLGIEPSQIVISQVGFVVAEVWSVAMVASAIICLYGPITDQWIGEFTGIPLLGSVLALYGGSAVVSSIETDSMILFAFGLILLAFASGLAARWRDVQQVKNNAGGVTPSERKSRGPR